ncbi:MAG: polysaccharide deacetylase family protein [Patescibacteria group bacterium]
MPAIKEYFQNKVTRRDFLKNLGLTGAFFLCQPLTKFNSFLPETLPGKETLDIEKLILADRIGVILEYHNPNYEGNVSMREKMFLSQLEFLKNNKYHTLGETEVIDFIQGRYQPPYKSAILRFDLGGGHREEFENIVIPALKKFAFNGLFYLTSGSLKEKEWWDDLVQWYKEGLIDVGSHSVSHPDFNMINQKQALKEAIDSKAQIEKEFSDRGEKIDVKGFAFPYDSASGRNFLKNTGYIYSFGGNLPGIENKFIQFGSYDSNSIPLLPSLYPYTDNWNAKNLPNKATDDDLLNISLVGNIKTFDRLVFNFTQTIFQEEVEKVVGKGNNNPLTLGKFESAEILPNAKGRFVRPSAISLYYKTNLESNSNVHFQISLKNGIVQKLPLYEYFVSPALSNLNNPFNIAVEIPQKEAKDIDEQLNSILIFLTSQYKINPERIFIRK